MYVRNYYHITPSTTSFNYDQQKALRKPIILFAGFIEIVLAEQG
jgi:hypothetical protein